MDSDHLGTIDVSYPDKFMIDSLKIQSLAKLIFQHLHITEYELHLEFVDQPEMLKLNKEFRQKEKSTDVLSFPQQEWKQPIRVKTIAEDVKTPDQNLPPKALGDIVISIPDAAANAENIGQSVDREICFLLIHGILHLCGHDHMDPEQEQLMLSEQKTLMDIIQDSTPPPYPWENCIRGLNT